MTAAALGERRALIVCVDDEPAVLNQLSAQISRAFAATHLVECAQAAEEALSLIRETFHSGNRVELVICDQVMPGMKGDRFLEIVHQEHPDVMKILLTGQAGLDSAIYAINHAGLHRYIEKPWEAADLQRSIENLLTQYRLGREVASQNDRLQRTSRELRALHDVALRLGAATQRSRLLSLVAETAKKLHAGSLSIFARSGLQETPHWWILPADGASGELTRCLTDALREGRSAPRAAPPGVVSVPLAHAGAVFGFILVGDATAPLHDTIELLSILASQAAASLFNQGLVEERIESERLSTVGRMIGTIVHDFKNPMTAIKGYAGMFEEHDIAADKRREFARLIIEEIDRMHAMTDEILEFTRGGQVRLHVERTSVDALATTLRRLTAPDFQERQLRFVTDLRYGGEIALDVDRIKRALLNIVSNAVDAMAPGGTFTLTSRLVDGRVELRLSNTGAGIPQDVLPRVFEPFFTHGKAHGIGMGMAITRKIVEDHGGLVSVESRPDATTFIVSLPLSAAPRD